MAIELSLALDGHPLEDITRAEVLRVTAMLQAHGYLQVHILGPDRVFVHHGDCAGF